MEKNADHYPPTVMEALKRFWSHDDTRKLLRGSGRVAVGTSGGADSQALLFLAGAPGPHRPDWAPEIVAFHIDHGLRDTSTDWECVQALCRRLGLRSRRRHLSQKRIEAEQRRIGSLEAALRSERYRALASMARQAHCEKVMTAHHRDDAAETFLLRLLRGSGLQGLGGMEVLTEVDGLQIGRPLLHWSRKEIRAMARRAGVAWSEDPSNREIGPMRNRLRHRIMPFIEKHTDHPPAARILARTACLLAREHRALEAVARPLYERHRVHVATERQIGLDITALLAEGPEEMLPYVLRRLWCELLQSAYPPSLEHLDGLTDYALHGGPRSLYQSAQNVVGYLDGSRRLWLFHKPRREMSRKEILCHIEREIKHPD